jgi:putative transposase
MSDYHRLKVPGTAWFFTVNLADRHGNRLLVDHIDSLREVLRHVRGDHPFRIDAMVVLPEHLHCIWTLPAGDSDYRSRWSLIKAGFSRRLPPTEDRSASRARRGERGICQRRYWAHLIRDERDIATHVD